VAEVQWLTHGQFVDRVSETFEVRGDSVAAVTLTLAETSVSDAPGGTGPDGTERRQFSLLFRGPADPILPQRTHRLEHADLGALDIFLVPLGPDSEGMRYEAVFA
jgi:uncharacterized protein DUF6916